MKKAVKAIQNSYQRAPIKEFVKTQKAKKTPMPKRTVSMKHSIKKPGGKA